MRYTISIDSVHTKEWGLNGNEAILFSWLYTLPSWAEKITLDDEVYFFASRNKVIDELPYLTDKPDTVYRHYKRLEGKGLIKLMRFKAKDYVALTNEGRKWMQVIQKENSEINPQLGNKSEERKIIPANSEIFPKPNSEKFPTNNNTISNTNNNTIRDKEQRDAAFVELSFSEKLIEAWNLWLEYKKNQFKFSYKDFKWEKKAMASLVSKSGQSNSIAIQIIDQSISNGWEGLFELKKSNCYAKKDTTGGYMAGITDYTINQNSSDVIS